MGSWESFTIANASAPRPVPIDDGRWPLRWHWTPDAESALRHRFAAEPFAAILESGPGFGDLGRWSIFALKPQATFSIKGCRWEKRGFTAFGPHDSPRRDCAPLDALRHFLATRARNNPSVVSESNEKSLPFTGGWIGLTSYDFAPNFERLPRRHPASLLPDMYWMYFSKAFVIDRREGIIHRVGQGWRDDDEAERFLEEVERPALSIVPPALAPPKSDWSKAEYIAAVERTKEYIRAGDIFQANITQRFSTTLHPQWTKPGRIADLWDRCVTMSPAPFSALIKTPEWSVLSTSPERFLLVEPDGRIETRPIKGTRPRGKSAKEDAAQMSELLASAKDRAELAMIVDLERNDLGRVCKFGSVKVAQHAALESYSNVHHLVSTVEGRLRDGCDVVDLLAAAFPGGSITGAPKIRAMEIIDELEACSRGVYTGAIGYISDHGRADFNIAIRTLVVEGDQAHYHVGGGITEGSDPEAEYEETLTKGSKLMRVLWND